MRERSVCYERDGELGSVYVCVCERESVCVCIGVIRDRRYVLKLRKRERKCVLK